MFDWGFWIVIFIALFAFKGTNSVYNCGLSPQNYLPTKQQSLYIRWLIGYKRAEF